MKLLDYVATYPDTHIRYHASDMILHVDSDVAYLVSPQARSRIAGFHYLSTFPAKYNPVPLNGGILVECKTLKYVVASAVEAEVTGFFHNAQTIIPIC